MFSNCAKNCFKLWCVLCAVQCTAHNTHHIGSLMMVQMDRNL